VTPLPGTTERRADERAEWSTADREAPNAVAREASEKASATMNTSYWIASTQPPSFPPVQGLPEVDVAVLGAGIAGVTAAHQLRAAGRTVALVDARPILTGVTGHTTAKVTSQHGLRYATLRDAFSAAVARGYGESQQHALEWLAEKVAELGVECDFSRQDNHVYAVDPDYQDALRAEADAAASLGLPASYVSETALPFEVVGAVRFTGQAQFHPRKWLLALAARIPGEGSYVLEGAPAIGLHEGDPHVVVTSAGEIRARDVVVATHYPAYDRGLYFARLSMRRELVVAAPVPGGSAPPGMYIGADTGHSLRTTPLGDGRDLLIAGGGQYRTGETSEVERKHRELTDWAGPRFGIEKFDYRWSAHDTVPVDGLPYIGRFHPRSARLWVATGFGAWGMTNGTLAGLLLSDLIQGKANPWAHIYDPNRRSVRQSAAEFARHNARTAVHFAADHLRAYTAGGPERIRPGEAGVCRVGGRLVAVYRDPAGEVSAVTANCTHMGCVLKFNDAETSWDCPCHGSRFDLEGGVLQGPANRPLGRVTLDPTEPTDSAHPTHFTQ
jgi:glycine/D-amino acid oxidase-like deaminating enzyme/nitrite reductase/ring-hydroxylating ferredoxin subunit